MVDEVARYSDADLAEFKEIIQNKIVKAQADLDLIKSAYMNDLNNGTDDTSPTFKAFEEGIDAYPADCGCGYLEKAAIYYRAYGNEHDDEFYKQRAVEILDLKRNPKM